MNELEEQELYLVSHIPFQVLSEPMYLIRFI